MHKCCIPEVYHPNRTPLPSPLPSPFLFRSPVFTFPFQVIDKETPLSRGLLTFQRISEQATVKWRFEKVALHVTGTQHKNTA